MLLLVSLFPLFARAGSQEQYNLDGFYQQVDGWIYAHCDPRYRKNFDARNLTGHFSYQPGGKQDLYGSVDVVYLIFGLGEMEDRTTLAGRAEWAKVIQGYQDPETGWFKFGNETPHFKAHATAYAVAGLKLLGAKPLYPLRDAQKITRSKEATDRWLKSILWDYIWVGSHQGGGIASSLQMTGEADDNWFKIYFDWLDARQDPDTGLWQLAFWNAFHKKPTRQEMGGAPHFWWVYSHQSRSLQYPEKIIDTCLGLQLPNGMWDDKKIKGIFQPYCINLDALWSINRSRVQLEKQGKNYREDDMERAFEKALAQITQSLNRPGSLQILYQDSHKLPGAIASLAEIDEYFQKSKGKTKIKTKKPLKQVLDYVSWL